VSWTAYVSAVSACGVQTSPLRISPRCGNSTVNAVSSLPVHSWLCRGQARQAGGHWFEPSTAHLTKAPLRRVFRSGDSSQAPATGILERIWKARTRFCDDGLVPDSAARLGVRIVAWRCAGGGSVPRCGVAASRAFLILSRSLLCDRSVAIEKSSLLQRRWARTELSGVLRPPSRFASGKCSLVGLQSLLVLTCSK
jgi:hypothetical protein